MSICTRELAPTARGDGASVDISMRDTPLFEREELIEPALATSEDRARTPWAIAEQDSWDWGDLEPAVLDAVTLMIVPDEMTGRPTVVAGLSSDDFDFVLARAADAVLWYVLDNPEVYGLTLAENSTRAA